MRGMRGMRRSLEEVRSIDRTRTIDYLLTYLHTYVLSWDSLFNGHTFFSYLTR